MIRNRLLRLSIVFAVSVTAMAGVSTATASAGLTGAGSTLVAPIMANWMKGFEASGGTSVRYSAVGSGTGIQQVSARTVDFGASDAPMTGEQASACGSCVTIPWALSATGVGFNVPGVKSLKLSGPVIAEMYLGRIKKWNDAKIKSLNKGVKLPATKVTPVFRSDGSGDTYAFTDFLSKASAIWRSKVGFSTSVGFPTGVGAKGNPGLTSAVSTTKGAIGYISASYLIAAGIKVAAVQNRAGKFEYPNLSNIAAAAATVKSVPASNTVSIAYPPKSAKTAYPISTFTYAIVPRDASQKSDIKAFVTYALTKGAKFGASLDFAPLPPVVLKAAKKAVDGL